MARQLGRVRSSSATRTAAATREITGWKLYNVNGYVGSCPTAAGAAPMTDKVIFPLSGARAVAARRGLLRRREPVARVGDVRHATSIDARSESSAPDGPGGAEAIAQRLPDQLAER
jgi:hypothetical protein